MKQVYLELCLYQVRNLGALRPYHIIVEEPFERLRDNDGPVIFLIALRHVAVNPFHQGISVDKVGHLLQSS